MARPALVLDASVGVKWFSDVGEAYVTEARDVMNAHANRDIRIIVPDIFFHEIANALTHKRIISSDYLTESITMLFDLDLDVYQANSKGLCKATQLARKIGITEYDAVYAVAACENSCPLVTANPRHQGKGLGCEIVSIEQWKLH